MEMESWMLLPLQWAEVLLDGILIMVLALTQGSSLDLEHTIIPTM